MSCVRKALYVHFDMHVVSRVVLSLQRYLPEIAAEAVPGIFEEPKLSSQSLSQSEGKLGELV